MNLESIATRLSQQRCGTLAKTIFVTEMPTDCKEGILLMGPYYGAPINQYLPGYIKTEFRVVVRGIEYGRAMTLAKKASVALKTTLPLALPGMNVKQMLPRNLPRPYRRSVAGYWEMEIDVDIVYIDTTA